MPTVAAPCPPSSGQRRASNKICCVAAYILAFFHFVRRATRRVPRPRARAGAPLPLTLTSHSPLSALTLLTRRLRAARAAAGPRASAPRGARAAVLSAHLAGRSSARSLCAYQLYHISLLCAVSLFFFYYDSLLIVLAAACGLRPPPALALCSLDSLLPATSTSAKCCCAGETEKKRGKRENGKKGCSS